MSVLARKRKGPGVGEQFRVTPRKPYGADDALAGSRAWSSESFGWRGGSGSGAGAAAEEVEQAAAVAARKAAEMAEDVETSRREAAREAKR